MLKAKLFSYNHLDTPIHRMSGLTKFICFLFLSFSVMISYDIRSVIAILIFAVCILRMSKIKYSQIRLMLTYVVIFIAINAVITYFFSPEQGVNLFGSRHEIARISGRYTITLEQILYQITKLCKYAAVVPLGITFLLTTNPSEFASSLNGVGVNYKAAYAVALTLRYFPDIQRDYTDISLAQQARGLDLSHKAKLSHRFKNALLIILPLIFSTLDRIELISNAMDLRGFGKFKRRSWYARKRLEKLDYIALALSAFVFASVLFLTIFVNKSRFYNPFIQR